MPAELASSVIERILKSEGPMTIQSGKKEYYGFREDHPNFPAIHKLVLVHGAESPQVKDFVSDLIRQRAEKAGALNFSSPGVQAAILSIAHMRGEGGVQAILNAVAGDMIVKSSKLTQKTIDKINSMTNEEFQNKLRDVREDYDKEIYGNKIDSIIVKGTLVKGRWWTLFGNGLTKRYDRERQEYLSLA